MSVDGTHLVLRLEGGPADQHRVPLTDLAIVATGVQTAVRNVGAVLAGKSTGRGGRKLGWIEQATELVLVAQPREGSVTLDLELSGVAPTLDMEVENDRLGPDALQTFVSGIEELSPDRPLPRGFDPGVLKALGTMAPLFGKGYRSLDVSLGTNGTRMATALTRDRVQLVRQMAAKPLKAPTSVEGVLLAVDLKGDPLNCRVDRPFLSGIPCLIPRTMRDVVRDLVDHDVYVAGIGEFDAGAEEPRRVHVTELRAAGGGRIDRTAWRQHQPWQEMALRQGTEPLHVDDLPNLFDDDEDLELFLAAAHGQTDG